MLGKSCNEKTCPGWLPTIIAGLIMFLTVCFMCIKDANAGVTMDVDKWNGPSGTWSCDTVRECYMKWFEAEQTGKTYYCNSVVIKRDGRVVWFKNYYPNTPVEGIPFGVR